MRRVNKNVLSAGDSVNTNGNTIDTNQIISASFQARFGDSNAAGTIKLQASNDTTPEGYDAQQAGFEPSHWVDIPNQSASITSGASALLAVAQCAYRWMRAVYTSTATGVQTVAPVADVAGSLNSKYFLLNSANAGTAYYVWMNVNSAGVDPMVAGRTGVEIAVATGATAGTIGTSIATAVDALANFAATGTTTVTITNSTSGPFIPITDGVAATHFTFAITAGGTTTIDVDMFGFSV